MWAVDLLASEYGWAKTDIYDDTYFDELFDFVQLINRRNFENYYMLLSISHNPHVQNPEKLMQALDQKIREVGGDIAETEQEDLDKSGFERLKLVMSQNPRMIVK